MAAAMTGAIPSAAATGWRWQRIRNGMLSLLKRLAAWFCTTGASDVVPEFYKYPPV